MMRRTIAVFLLALGFSLPGFAQLPKLVDRELFFGDPEISGSQISPDGRFITFLKPLNGVRNIWVKGALRAVRASAGDHRRYGAAGEFLFLVPGQQVRPVRPG